LVPTKAKAEAAPEATETQAEAAPIQEETVAEQPLAEAPPSAETSAAEKTIQRVDKSGMSIDDILAYCRQHDAK
jgi:hypothetical protein